MRKNYVALFASLLCVCLSSFNLYAQEDTTKPKYPIPEFMGKVYLYNEETNTIKELTNCTVEYVVDKGILQDVATQAIMGEKSPSRIQKAQKLRFLLKCKTNYDIQEKMMLLKLTYNPKKKRREALAKNRKENIIYFKNKRVWTLTDGNAKRPHDLEYVYMLTAENLEPGEYIWSSEISTCFGID